MNRFGPNPFAGMALDYLIGADGPQRGKAGRVTETPFGAAPVATGHSIAYCNLRREDGEPPEYGPYLPPDDILRKYGEGRPDPKHEGFRRNIIEQLDHCKRLGHAFVEQDNPDSYPLSAVMAGLDLAQERELGVIAKNPKLVKGRRASYVAHPNVFGIIVEEDCGTAAEMDQLRREAGKPQLPVWFVSYEDGRGWAVRTAQDIRSAGYINMSVTYSSNGEYGSSEDVLAPIPAPMPAPLPAHAPEALATGPTGAKLMDTNQAQTILSNIGLLDPPADGVMGPVTKWALSEFCRSAGVPFDGTISDAVGQALAAARPLPLTPGNDLAGRIVTAMIAKGHWVARHPDCVNIVYVEGMNSDGSPNGNPPNEFNDRRLVIRIVNGVSTIQGSWEATTEPGRYWTENPMNPKGAARVAFGQYKAWSEGDYHGSDSLLQAAPIPVYRDLAQDYKREGAPDVGMFGIHQHWGYDLPKNNLGRSSAGCLVGRSTDGHREFMALIRTDARYRANPQYKFLTTLLPVEALTHPVVVAPPIAPQLPLSIPTPVPAPVPPPYTPQVDPVAAALAQLVAQFKERMMSMTYPAPAPLPIPAPVPTSPTPSTDLTALLRQVLLLLQGMGPQPTGTTTPSPTQQVDQLRKLVEVISGIVAPGAQGGPRPLGQVNSALGQTIGNLLNGKKSAIGIVGAVLTSVLQTTGPDLPLSKIIPLITSSAGLGSVAMPLFLAVTAWGVLGKMEKWSQGATLLPQPSK